MSETPPETPLKPPPPEGWQTLHRSTMDAVNLLAQCPAARRVWVHTQEQRRFCEKLLLDIMHMRELPSIPNVRIEVVPAHLQHVYEAGRLE